MNFTKFNMIDTSSIYSALSTFSSLLSNWYINDILILFCLKLATLLKSKYLVSKVSHSPTNVFH